MRKIYGEGDSGELLFRADSGGRSCQAAGFRSFMDGTCIFDWVGGIDFPIVDVISSWVALINTVLCSSVRC